MLYLIIRESEELYIRVIASAMMVLFLWSIILQSKNVLHMLQLSSYNVDQYNIWLKKNKKTFDINRKFTKFLIAYIIFLIVFAIGYKIYADENSWDFVILYIIIFPFLLEGIASIFSLFLIIEFIKNRNKKKELKYTPRIIRNIICNILIYIVIATLAILILKDVLVIFESLIITLLVITAPMITYLSFLLMLPIENNFKRKFVNKGSEKLKNSINTKVVGITGSFGKTSVKNFLYQILIKKYNTCKTPESYNTPMGVVITINEHLKSYDDIFICEMGARRVGDIKEICDIVYPKDAIVTEVGAMHLDTFKTIDNVLKTKMELVENVVKCMEKSENDKNNIILLNGDNEYIKQYIKDKNYDIKILDKIYYVGEKSDNDFCVSDTKCSKDGSVFLLKIGEKARKAIKSDEKEYAFSTKLIGKNNIKDIAFAISYAMLQDVSMDDIISAVKGLEQVRNRLELINVNDNTILVNDAYNSNPVGAKIAIDTVSLFDGYKKIIVTPGMVELGEKQYEKNNEMAKYASEYMDEVIVVGDTNKDALMSGACDKAFFIKEEKDAIAYTMNENERKIILLENDLTDNY